MEKSDEECQKEIDHDDVNQCMLLTFFVVTPIYVPSQILASHRSRNQ